MSADPASVVTAFLAEFDIPNPDPARLADYFADDAVYHNIPLQPIAGRAAIAAFLANMGPFQPAGFEVTRQLAAGDVVMNERVDHFTASGRTFDLPVMGIFELRDGKIAAWRDYFDLAMFQKALAGS